MLFLYAVILPRLSTLASRGNTATGFVTAFRDDGAEGPSHTGERA
jgi:hypothetical protein